VSFTAGLWAYLQTGLLLLAATSMLPSRLRARAGLGIVMPLLLLPAPFMPLGESNLTGHVYAYTGALSLPGMFLVAMFIAHRLSNRVALPEREYRLIMLGATVATLILYPFALGLGKFDPYALGYGGKALPVTLCLGAALAW
jgi:hypothetical protein